MCNSTYCDRVPEPQALPAGKYALYTSSNAGSRLQRTDGSFVTSLDSQWSGEEIDVDNVTTYQVIYGFGGAFTDSAGINIKSLSPNAQLNLLKCVYAIYVYYNTFIIITSIILYTFSNFYYHGTLEKSFSLSGTSMSINKKNTPNCRE